MGREAIGLRMSDLVANLLDACNDARRAGLDFPSIWNNILKNHPLVTGEPVQGYSAVGPMLEIPLFAGQILLFDTKGFTIK
jgi:hypothetical protein